MALHTLMWAQLPLCRFLLGPLTALDGNMGSGARPCVLLLLDALDEADDDGRGWEPVASLIASE